jgi:hypothetical protein
MAIADWLVLCYSGMMMTVVVFGLRRAPETQAILLSGWADYLALESAGQEEAPTPDVREVARWCRTLAISVFGLSLVYWAGVSELVDRRVGLAGALLYLVELVLNVELLEFLAGSPEARLSDAGARLVMGGYYLLAGAQGALIVLTVGILLAR